MFAGDSASFVLDRLGGRLGLLLVLHAGLLASPERAGRAALLPAGHPLLRGRGRRDRGRGRRDHGRGRRRRQLPVHVPDLPERERFVSLRPLPDQSTPHTEDVRVFREELLPADRSTKW